MGDTISDLNTRNIRLHLHMSNASDVNSTTDTKMIPKRQSMSDWSMGQVDTLTAGVTEKYDITMVLLCSYPSV